MRRSRRPQSGTPRRAMSCRWVRNMCSGVLWGSAIAVAETCSRHVVMLPWQRQWAYISNPAGVTDCALHCRCELHWALSPRAAAAALAAAAAGRTAHRGRHLQGRTGPRCRIELAPASATAAAFTQHQTEKLPHPFRRAARTHASTLHSVGTRRMCCTRRLQRCA